MLTGVLFGTSRFKYPALMSVHSIVVAIVHEILQMLYNVELFFSLYGAETWTLSAADQK